ncbi:MAG: tandem-95 repeat protein, partial [Flammeovirgaceae bacterium]|nr:tandem-95 repeat protein [Flammeovirgaceae bacterium]
YSQSSGNFNDTNRWNTARNGTGTNVTTNLIDGNFNNGIATFVIQPGHSITTSSPVVVYNLTLEDVGTSAGTLLLGNQPFQVLGDLLIEGDGDVPDASLTITSANFTVDKTTTIYGELNDTDENGSSSFKGAVTVYGIWNTTAANASTSLYFFEGVTLGSAALFDAGWAVATYVTPPHEQIFISSGSAAFNIQSLSMPPSGLTLRNQGVLKVGSLINGTLINENKLHLQGLVVGTTIDATSHIGNEVIYDGTSSQSILSIPYHHLSISGSGTKNLLGNITVHGNFHIRNTFSGIFQQNTHTINVKGNWTKEAGTYSSGTGSKILFTGTTDQTFIHNAFVQGLEVNKPTGKVICVAYVGVQDNLHLAQGNIELQSGGILEFNNPSVTLTGSPFDNTKMIITNGGAFKLMLADAFNSNVLIPLGTGTTYSPVHANITPTGSGEFYLTAVQGHANHTPNTGTHSLQRYWTVVTTGITGLTGTLNFSYPPAEANGTETDYVPARWNGTSWVLEGSPLNVIEGSPLSTINFNVTTHFNFTSHKFTAGEGISFLRVNTNNLTMPETNVPIAYQNYPIYGFSLQAETASTTLNGFKFRTTNTSTYTLSDITSFNLWESSDAIFSPSGDLNLGSFTGDLLPGGEKTIPFSSPFSAGQTKYYFITANVSNSATIGRTIQVESIQSSDFSFSHAFSFTGLPLAAGDTHTIQTALFYSRTSNALDNPTTWNTKVDGTGFNAQPHYLNNIETDGVADFIIQGGHIISPASSPVVMNHLSLLDNNTTTRLNLSSQNLIIKGNLTINGDGTAPNPEITLNTGNFTVEGNTSINGELSDNDDNGIDLFKGAVTIGNTGKWNTTAVASSIHLLFEGGITNDGLFSANSARFQTSTNQTLIGTFTFSGDLDVFGGASGTKTVTNIGVITVGNITASTAGGTPYFVNGANARVNLTGTNYFGDFASHVNTLNFAGNSLQTIVSSSVHHLEVSGTGGAKLSGDLTVLGNLLITSYSSLDMDNYDLFLRGNLTTQNSSSLITNTNTIIFEGNAVQTIRHYSAGDFYRIRINKTGGRVVLDNNITVSGFFEVGTNPLCLLDLNNHTLTITNGTTFLGTYDANHMIIANNGHVRVVFGTPSGTYTQTIPIGTGTIYSPAVFNAVNFVSTGGYLTVSVSNTDGTNVLGGGAYSLNRKWLVSYQNLSLTGGSSTFYYQDSDVSGTETNYLPARYNGIAWSVIGTTTDVYETANLIIIPNPFNGTSAGTQYEFTAGESNAFIAYLLPSISLNTTTFSYTEDNPPISLFNAVHISSYSNSLSSAVVRFIGTYSPTQDTLIYTPTPNFSVQWNDNTGLLFISSPLGTTDYENFLANVRYRNTSNAPTVGIRTIEVYVVDGFGQSNIESVTVNVNAVNDAPTFTTSPISWQATEDTPLEIATSALITNAGGKDEDGVRVHGIAITSVNSLHGTWSYSTNGINWINLPNNLSNASALLLLNHSTRKLRFVPSVNFSGNIANALRFRLWDGTNGLTETTLATTTPLIQSGAYSVNEVVVNLNVVEENDPPTFDLIGTLITLTEDAPLTVINLATNIHDGDNGTQPLTFTVTSTLVSGNLTFSVLSMNQLGQLSIQPMPNTYGEATLSIRLSDGALTTTKTATVQVSPINDAPIVTLLVPHWQVLEDASLASRKVISASDLEGNPLTYSVAALTGNTLLNTLYMLGEELWVKPNQNANGTAILEITVSDGMLETKVQLTIEIIPVNDAPIVTLLVPHWRISEDEGLVSHRIVQAYDVENSPLNHTVEVVNRTGNLEFDTLYMKADTLWVKTRANTFGKAILKIAVSDGSLNTTVQMTLEVDPVNDPPIFALSADSVLLSENFVGEVSITAELLIEEDNEQVVFRLMPSPSEISFMQVRFDSLSGRITLQSIPNRFG